MRSIAAPLRVCVNQLNTHTAYGTNTHTHMQWLISPCCYLPPSHPLFGNPRSFGIVKNLVTLSDQLPRLMLQLLRGLFLVRLSRLKMATHIPDEPSHHSSPPTPTPTPTPTHAHIQYGVRSTDFFFLASVASGGGSCSKYLFYVQPCGRFFPWALIILSCLPIVCWLRFLCRL